MPPELVNGIKLVPPTLLVSTDKDVKLDLGHRVLDLHAWPPMHTDCDVTIFDEKTATLFGGDLVFLQHVPVVDGSVIGWLKAMPDLAKIPAKRVVPGHGTIDVDWPQALAAEQTLFKPADEGSARLHRAGRRYQCGGQRCGKVRGSEMAALRRLQSAQRDRGLCRTRMALKPPAKAI